MNVWVKALLIAVPVWLVIIIGLGMFAGEGGNPAERIDRQCQRSDGFVGEQAVLDCKMEMMARRFR